MQRTVTTFVALLTLAMSGQLYAFMGKDASYSGVRHVESSQGSMDMQVYHAPQMERVKLNSGGQTTVAILRLDRKVTWLLIPQSHAYMETSFDRYKAHTPEKYDVLEHKKVGTEMINGYKAVKYRVKCRTKDGTTGSGYYWVVNDSIPIKMDLTMNDNGQSRHFVMELRNLKIGPQKRSLFQPPAGYKKVNMPGMGAAMSNGAAQHSAAGQTPPASGQSSGQSSETSNAAKDIGDAAANEAKQSTKSEVKHAVGNFVHGLFH